MKDNPIRKRTQPVGWCRWYGTCPHCGKNTPSGRSRKTAKDALHWHVKKNCTPSLERT